MSLHRPDSAQHIAQFYERDEVVTVNVACLSKETLHQGDSVILAATPPHRDAIEKLLIGEGLDLVNLRKSGRYIALDAAATLATLARGGSPDRAKFDHNIRSVISGAIERSANRFAFAFGEMVALLCAANRRLAAVQLEQLWNALAVQHHFSLYCAYPLSAFGNDADIDALLSICSEHSLSIPVEYPAPFADR